MHLVYLPARLYSRMKARFCVRMQDATVTFTVAFTLVWHVAGFPAPCNVGDGVFKYSMGGDIGNPFFFMFVISNTR